MARVQQHRATPQRMPLADVLSNQGIDGQRTGTARPFPLCAFERPVLAARRSNYSGVIFPPGPNSWPLNIPAGWLVPAHPVNFISIAQECGLFATYRALSSSVENLSAAALAAKMLKTSTGRFHFEPPSPFISFDHLVGAGKQGWRHFEAERLRGDQVNDEIEFGRLFDRQIGRLRSAQYFVDVI